MNSELNSLKLNKRINQFYLFIQLLIYIKTKKYAGINTEKVYIINN